MKNSVIEIIAGAVVLLLAALFLLYGYAFSHKNIGSGVYRVTAVFSKIDGLLIGNDVRIGGVKVGSVTNISIDPKTYQANVQLEIGKDIVLPDDTAALVASESFLGGKYVSLSPGGSEAPLKENDKITYTQSAVSLEELIGKYIFSNSSDNKKTS